MRSLTTVSAGEYAGLYADKSNKDHQMLHLVSGERTHYFDYVHYQNSKHTLGQHQS